jgi:nitrite reductase/ring-hydroxylating ferredoxin subunit
MKIKRRDMLKSLVAISGTIAITPFLSVKDFLIRSITFNVQRQRIANVNDLPPNSRLIFTYPITGDSEMDSDPFRKFVLIRLPDGTFKAYSTVCLHLWCLIDYKPERRQIECPCHGSIYDPNTGVAIRGPAALQRNKTLPEVKIEIDDNGDIYANGIIGVIGYGKEGVR